MSPRLWWLVARAIAPALFLCCAALYGLWVYVQASLAEDTPTMVGAFIVVIVGQASLHRMVQVAKERAEP